MHKNKIQCLTIEANSVLGTDFTGISKVGHQHILAFTGLDIDYGLWGRSCTKFSLHFYLIDISIQMLNLCENKGALRIIVHDALLELSGSLY